MDKFFGNKGSQYEEKVVHSMNANQSRMLQVLNAMQAWLVPHSPEESANIGCGFGPVAAVHSGFSASWQKGLKAGVGKILRQAVKQSSKPASEMRMLITGTQ